MARTKDDDKEGMLAPIAAGVAVLLVFGFLIWLVAGHRIVYGTLAPALLFGAMWKWVPSDFTYSQWNEVVRIVGASAPQPWTVSFVTWLDLVAVAFRPLFILLMAMYLVSLIFIARSRQGFMRRFTADQLMLQTVKTYTGIAPVIAIRQLIAKNLHPKWRRQIAPDEVFLQYRVPKGAPGLAPAGAPMVRDGKFDREVARTYFMGITKAVPAGELQRSEMLGRQVVDLVKDTRGSASAVFSDRMSAEGKTLLALWAAVAFGGEAGRAEYGTYRDLLNRSAYGTKDGMANLALAQPLYDKYRKHPMLVKLFAIHHWENTVLFFLLSLAQKKGRFTTAEVLWLRPTNRVMFFALNSRGSYTPHTEAAATFAQFAYEAACARSGRLPVAKHDDTHLPMIYIDKAIDGLELEYARWAEGTESDDDWWLRQDIWARSNTAIVEWGKQAASTTPAAPMPGVGAEETSFDKAAAAQAQAVAAADGKDFNDELARMFGSNGTAHQ